MKEVILFSNPDPTFSLAFSILLYIHLTTNSFYERPRLRASTDSFLSSSESEFLTSSHHITSNTFKNDATEFVSKLLAEIRKARLQPNFQHNTQPGT